MRTSRRLLTMLASACCLVALPTSAANAARAPGQPPRGKVLLGVAKSSPASFSRLTGSQHSLQLAFTWWGSATDLREYADQIREARGKGVRWILSLNATRAQSPGWIASGKGDDFLVELGATLNTTGTTVWVRPMAEMNGWWNTYCAVDQHGAKRGAAFSTRSYRRAFQRIALVMHGGNVEGINKRLRALSMPALRTDRIELPDSGLVGTVWNPQGQGSPNVPGNQPKDYWPGPAYVDYVGNDLYAQRGNAFWPGMDSLYNAYRKPYIIAEWAPWGYDDPAFATHVFDWVAHHPRTVGLVYFNGSGGVATFSLAAKKATLKIYRARTREKRYRLGSGDTFGDADRQPLDPTGPNPVPDESFVFVPPPDPVQYVALESPQPRSTYFTGEDPACGDPGMRPCGYAGKGAQILVVANVMRGTVLTERPARVYVERLGESGQWSLVHTDSTTTGSHYKPRVFESIDTQTLGAGTYRFRVEVDPEDGATMTTDWRYVQVFLSPWRLDPIA